MAQPFVGEIRMFGGNFAPSGWAFCDGRLMSISENDTLYNLIGTTYGGDGVNTFGLPNLLCCVPISQGQGPGLSTRSLGQAFGAPSLTLTAGNMPPHNHSLSVSNAAGTVRAPSVVVGLADVGRANDIYTTVAVDTAMIAGSVGLAGSGTPISTLQPTLCVTFIISLFGIFPSQN